MPLRCRSLWGKVAHVISRLLLPTGTASRRTSGTSGAGVPFFRSGDRFGSGGLIHHKRRVCVGILGVGLCGLTSAQTTENFGEGLFVRPSPTYWRTMQGKISDPNQPIVRKCYTHRKRRFFPNTASAESICEGFYKSPPVGIWAVFG